MKQSLAAVKWKSRPASATCSPITGIAGILKRRIVMMRYPLRMGIVALAAMSVAACATTAGVGTGETPAGKARVAFTWTSRNAVTGSMTAVVASTNQTFTGTYFQVTSQTRVNDLMPLWIGWYRPWYGWPYWGPGYGPDFVTYYSGRVVANLSSPNGQHMRCDFRLVSPSRGMAGGGMGHCQLPDDETIDTMFAAD
jgi:predicted small secreted protein